MSNSKGGLGSKTPKYIQDGITSVCGGHGSAQLSRIGPLMYNYNIWLKIWMSTLTVSCLELISSQKRIM